MLRAKKKGLLFSFFFWCPKKMQENKHTMNGKAAHNCHKISHQILQ